MSKYDNLKILKKTKAKIQHQYQNCGGLIHVGNSYYSEELKDRFLHSLRRKKFCQVCYQKHGNKKRVGLEIFKFQGM